MKRLASVTSVAFACGLIVVVNLTLLGAAGWNRRGEPLAELSLTERELAVPAARQDDGTGLELSLATTQEPPGVVRRVARWKRRDLPAVDLEWLDAAKLRELGFRLDLDATNPDAAEHYKRSMPRRAWVVLEYEGQAWRSWISGREERVAELRGKFQDGGAEAGPLADAEALLALDRTMRSRLFPVDAGLDAEALQRRYGDRPGHVVLAGLIRPKVVRPEGGEPVLGGEVLNLVVNRVHVSHGLRPPLETFLPEETWEQVETRERREAESGWPSAAPPRYRAVLAIGRRHLPWLVGVERTERIGAPAPRR